MEQNRLSNFGRGRYEKQFCEIIFNLGKWLRRRRCLKIFYFKLRRPILFNRNIMFFAIMVKGIIWNIHVKIWTSSLGGDDF